MHDRSKPGEQYLPKTLITLIAIASIGLASCDKLSAYSSYDSSISPTAQALENPTVAEELISQVPPGIVDSSYRIKAGDRIFGGDFASGILVKVDEENNRLVYLTNYHVIDKLVSEGYRTINMDQPQKGSNNELITVNMSDVKWAGSFDDDLAVFSIPKYPNFRFQTQLPKIADHIDLSNNFGVLEFPSAAGVGAGYRVVLGLTLHEFTNKRSSDPDACQALHLLMTENYLTGAGASGSPIFSTEDKSLVALITCGSDTNTSGSPVDQNKIDKWYADSLKQ